MIYHVRQNQNILDIATQIYGDIQFSPLIARDNKLNYDFRVFVEELKVNPIRKGKEEVKQLILRNGVIVSHGFEGGRVLATEGGVKIEFPDGLFLEV